MYNPRFTGKKHSTETKIKMSSSLKKFHEINPGKAKDWASEKVGKPLSDEHRNKVSENHADVSMEKNPRWGGGKRIAIGYILVRKPGHPFCGKGGYVGEHRLVIEDRLKITLLPMAIVHHKNGIKTDNRFENLEVMSKSEHMRLHSSERERNDNGAFI